jgi:hypothetical protein
VAAPVTQLSSSFPTLPRFANSVFTQLLPSNPNISPLSAQQIQYYGNIQISNGGIDISPSQYDPSAPIYWAKTSDPLYTINCNAWSGNSCPSLQGKQINIPSYAKWGSYPSPNCSGCPRHGNFDGQMVVISPDGTMEYDFWQADQFPGSSGGNTFTVSSGEAFPINVDNEFGPGGWPGSATAAHRALTAGILLPSDITNGVVSHALTIAAPCVSNLSLYPVAAGISPATAISGGSCGGGLPKGARVFLAMSDSQISSLSLNPVARMIYTAMAHYGAYITDTSGESSTWYLVGYPNVHTWTDLGLSDPWPAAFSAVGIRNASYSNFSEFPINMSFPGGLQNYLKVADPCVTLGGPVCL